jgi:Gpi18-like mannosyltransferase
VTEIVLLWFASRIGLLVTGILSSYLVASGLMIQTGNLRYHEPTVRALEIWARWDAEWYLLIAGEGYDASDHFEHFAVPYEASATVGFLPLYPLLIRALSPVLGGVGAGVLISNLALLGSLFLLYRLTAAEAQPGTGRSSGLAACAAMLIFPTSLFFSAVYAESLFLLLSLGTFCAARNRRFALAGVLGGLATLTRPLGVLLVLPVLTEWWQAWRAEKSSPMQASWVLMIPAGLGVFMLFCQQLFGDPLALFHRQARWRGGLSGPWQAFARWWDAGPVAHGAHGSTFELAIAVIALALLPMMVRRLRPSFSLYTIAALALALGSTLWSFARVAMTLFPFFMLAGVVWGERQPPAVALLVLYGFLATILSGLLMALYANWWWAG